MGLVALWRNYDTTFMIVTLPVSVFTSIFNRVVNGPEHDAQEKARQTNSAVFRNMAEALQGFKPKQEGNDSDDDKKPPPPYLGAIQMSNMLPTAPPTDEANHRSSGPPSTFYPAQPGINSQLAKSLTR
jgi:hypothetical protein